MNFVLTCLRNSMINMLMTTRPPHVIHKQNQKLKNVSQILPPVIRGMRPACVGKSLAFSFLPMPWMLKRLLR